VAKAITIPSGGNNLHASYPSDPPAKACVLQSLWFYIASLPNRLAVLVDDDGATEFDISFDNAGDIGGQVSNLSFGTFGFASAGGILQTGRWNHAAYSTDSNHPDGEKLAQVYLNGVDVFDHFDDGAPAFLTQITGGIYFGLGAGAGQVDLSLADYQRWIRDDFVDLSVAGNLAKLISGGKPVDPVIAAVAFGEQSDLFSGDATGFLSNQGTNWGTLSSAGSPPTNATTSPSD
jgi:hypothetical protein